jgi:hypothetical protein
VFILQAIRSRDQAAIIALFRVLNHNVGNLPPMPGVFPDYPAPVVCNVAGRVPTARHCAIGPDRAHHFSPQQ